MVPCYQLRACHHGLADDLNPSRLGLWDAITSIRWKLWDEKKRRMVQFPVTPKTMPPPNRAQLNAIMKRTMPYV